jgi:hypothetical protein
MAILTVGVAATLLLSAAAAWLCKQLLAWLYKFYTTKRWLKVTDIPGPPASNKLTGAWPNSVKDQCSC